ncbi:SDHC, cytochrome b subunit of succinate dehydrogenase [Dendrothele bispora CBS 962.96]|uniref:SDHC, cytochrome b subunit of succinate dehydrogenase n=1 Tax=Dendrothele bispora (strain CBS 962.96) TaxID=1314807 RepID=A0A4S8MIX5_DENBC|nr:SDHC, cytochrome b subunit of succinate dehydrogenase [Dendrothele bispora CBS 962.96]
MLSTRAVGLGPSLRQAAFRPTRAQALKSVVRTSIAKRTIQTERLKPTDAIDILNKQRLSRPSSPHFTIYQPQLTWLGSIFNRATGVALSALLYGFSLAYLFAPTTFDSAHVIEFVQGLPDAVKYGGKFLLSLPFTFHSFNGLRHLAWDSGRFLTVKSAYSTGYAVIGATALSTLYLTFF